MNFLGLDLNDEGGLAILHGTISQGLSINQGEFVFAQPMPHLLLSTFRRCVTHYLGERKIMTFSCLDQFLSMAFAQLTDQGSPREIEACPPEAE